MGGSCGMKVIQGLVITYITLGHSRRVVGVSVSVRSHAALQVSLSEGYLNASRYLQEDKS